MKKYFAVSDVHSFFYELQKALEQKGFDESNKDHIIIICGDAFDRGPESKKMFDFMQSMFKENRLVYIRGNHEDLLFDCVRNINKSVNISYHHVTNGTIKTLADITGHSEFDVYLELFDTSFHSKVDDLLMFINNSTVDYFKLGRTIFVHGWVPSTTDIEGKLIVHENYLDGGWKHARWDNGQEMFLNGIFPSDVETVVCGHWHTSWGWANIKKEHDEWGPKATFRTLIHVNDSGQRIVALDACTAHTNFINCVIFDEEGNIICE